jgi:glycerol-3-phosphate dehydrogenase (NAD(P)+)
MKDALDLSQAVLFALPAAYIQSIFSQIEPCWLEDKLLITSIKGFIPGTGSLPSHYVDEYSGQYRPVMTVSGPCHAEEIATERSTYLTVAGENQEDVQLLSQSLKVKYIQPVRNNDPTGVEYVAILKNIIAVASGISCGLNYGQNFQSVLVSNAMREVNSFLHVMDPRERDLFDSAYFGDLLVTAYSDYSRNKTLGKLIGRGIKIQQAIQSMAMIAEGYSASRELHEATRDLNIPLPIINSVYRILHQHANPFHEFKLIEKQLR